MAPAKVSAPIGLGPAVAQVAGQVQEGGEAAGGAGELGRPAGQVGQVAAVGGQPRLQVALEAQQQLARLRVEGRAGPGRRRRPGRQAGGQGLELQGVAVGHRRGTGGAPGWRRPTRLVGEAVQEPGQQPAAAEPGPAGQPAQDLGLDGQADGQTGPLDVFGGSAAAVDLEQVAGVALEVDAEVGAGGSGCSGRPSGRTRPPRG